MSKRQITMADIARELNISTATVSRALKDYPDISKETKRKVAELAKKLNYRPNSIAAGLRKRESKVIGVIIPEIVNHFFSGVIKGIMDVAYNMDYRVMICQSDESYEKEVTDARALLASRVDGLLVSLAHETQQYDHFLEFQELGIPIVLFDKVSDQIQCSKVEVDDYQGALEAVSHLIAQGCKRIAHFSGPSVASTSRHRLNGYRAALETSGYWADPVLTMYCKDLDLNEGKQFAKEIMKLPEPPDGIFCVTDTIALGAIAGLKELGISVPSDVAIVGFSNWKVSALLDPPLTSVSQPSFPLGQQAARLLLKQIQDQKNDIPASYEHITLPTELKVRSSSLFNSFQASI